MTETATSNAYTALWDYCVDQGWSPPELIQNGKSEKGPKKDGDGKKLPEGERVHGLILYVESPDERYGMAIPANKTIEEAAQIMCTKLGITVPGEE